MSGVRGGWNCFRRRKQHEPRIGWEMLGGVVKSYQIICAKVGGDAISKGWKAKEGAVRDALILTRGHFLSFVRSLSVQKHSTKFWLVRVPI
jgi:hypothetical protein